MIDGHAIYCDDLRMENNGKLLLIGVYHLDMILSSFPATIDKIFIVVRFRYTLEEGGKHLTIRAYSPTDTDTPSIDYGIDLAEAPSEGELKEIPRAWPDGPLYGNMLIPLMLERVQINALSFIRVELLLDGKQHRLNSLKVSALPPTEKPSG